MKKSLQGDVYDYFKCYPLFSTIVCPRILLVDDEQDITSVLKTGLEKEGFEVTIFNKPEEALSSFEKEYYNDIIIDIKMPDMDGFQLARELWKVDANAKICFLTAFEIYEEEAKKVFPSLNGYCFIKKPIRIEALANHIRSHLQEKR
jgi:DNA-binding response OmpR family regulator